MKKVLSIIGCMLAAFYCIPHQTKVFAMDTNAHPATISIFPQGEELKSPNFSGRVWLKMLVPESSPLQCPIGNVTFEPGCRNSWHKHTSGQILLVTSGQGLYQERGKAAQALRAGDTVTIAPQVEHWHGAAADAWFTHLAITPNPQTGSTTWLKAVTAEEYAVAGANATSLSPSAAERPANVAASAATATPRLSEASRKKHAQLFPHHQSSLRNTDPELVEIFDNFALDEVLRYGNLDERTRLMTILAAHIASQALTEYTMMLGAALNVGVTPVEIKEVLYQAVPYVGIAKVYDFIHATNAVLHARGITLPLKGQSTTSPADRHAKGLAQQKAIFGEQIDKMYQEAPASQLHIQNYLSANCFGDYVTRSGLDTKMRELLTFSILIALGGCEPQLKGHITGNANVGNDKATLLSVATQLLPYVGYPRTLNAIRCVNESMPEQK